MSWQSADIVRRQMPPREAGLYDGLAELGVLTSTAARRRQAARTTRVTPRELGRGVGRQRD